MNLSNIKYIITFSTHGSVAHDAGNVLPTMLTRRIPEAVFAGHINIRVPENWVPLEPTKPYVDTWDAAEMAAMQKQAASVVAFISEEHGSRPRNAPFKEMEVDKSLYMKTFSYAQSAMIFDKTKCVKCGVCFRNCPYHAITMSKDIEDGYPVYHQEWCYLCCLCFNKCPTEAINMKCSLVRDIQRHKESAAELTPEKAKQKGLVPVVTPPLDQLFKRLEEGDIHLF